jgi:glycerol-3-phosphate acyltransferase PlsY
LGYLLGSIPVALLVARRHGVDLRRTGDGNPGAWNALEQLGGRRALPAFLGDAAKGLGVLGAMAGHAFPLFAGFRGGKAVMTFVGGGLALAPWAAAVCLALCLAVSLVFSFKWGARAGVFAFPFVQLATDPVAHVAATGVLMSLIGLLFLLDTSGRARSAPAAQPPS